MSAYVNNKILYVYNDSGLSVPFATVLNEIFLTADLIYSKSIYDNYREAVLAPNSIRVVGLFLCNDDWTVKDDVSGDVTSCSCSFTHQSGQTRTASISLFNGDGKWNPNPVNGRHWKGTRFILDIGLYYEGTIYWKHCGRLAVSSASLPESEKVISLNLCDKFGFFDGTIGGKTSGALQISAGTSVYNAVKACLEMEKENGQMYDSTPFIFPRKHLEAKTPYTITKTPNYSIGDILKELGTMIFCDVYYDECGHLVLEDALEDNTYDENFTAISWFYHEEELAYANATMDIDYSSIINVVTVKGAIANGKQYSGTATNDNPKSQTNIQMTEPNVEEIEDSNISGDSNCLNRAKYELKNKTLLPLSIKYDSIFLPHLNTRNIVEWSNDYYKLKESRLLVTSVNLDVISGLMSISAINVNEVVL